MNSRRLVNKTLCFDSPQRVPRQTWVLPRAEIHQSDVVKRLQQKFPDDIVSAPAVYKRPLGTVGDRHARGIYVDEWGCTFTNPRDGVIGIVKKPLVSEWKELQNFRIPGAVLSLDRDEVNAFCRQTDKFVLAGTFQRPFERLQFIRTMKQAFIDLAEQPPGLFELLKRIHELYLKEVEVWAQTDVDSISLMDDWGTQDTLMVSPELWRRLFKPMYEDYVEVARHYRKYVFMHSDGYITDIIPELIEIGVDALNSQVFCMGVKELGEKFRGKITFWGEIDRQLLLPGSTRSEIEQAVEEMWSNLYEKGGVIAQCEFGFEANLQNIFTFFEAWDRLSQF